MQEQTPSDDNVERPPELLQIAGIILTADEFNQSVSFFLNWLRPQMKGSMDAEDILQEVLLSCLQAKIRDGEVAGFRKYIFGALRRQAATVYKRMILERTQSGQDISNLAEREIQLEKYKLLDDLIAAMMSKLSEIDRKVFQGLINGESTKQIADRLKKSSQAIRNSIRRIKSLRENSELRKRYGYED